jgi:hypothetical protein
MFYDPVRLHTLARFSAPDPWSENQLTDYSIDEYVMLPLGSKRNLDSKWSLHTFGIRWERDSRYRLLPESLVELWKCQRISPEKLPWLLHAIEPRLLETDCITTQSWQRSVGIPLLLLLLVSPLVFLLIRVDGQAMPPGAAVGSGLAMAMLTGAILWIMKSSKRSRVKQQMTWAINRISGDSSSGPVPAIAAPTTVFFRLWLKLCVFLIALVALVLGAGVAFFKISG